MTTTTMHCRAPSSIRFVPTPPIPPQQFERRCNCVAVAVVVTSSSSSPSPARPRHVPVTLAIASPSPSPSRPCHSCRRVVHPHTTIAPAIVLPSLSLSPAPTSPARFCHPHHCIAVTLTRRFTLSPPSGSLHPVPTRPPSHTLVSPSEAQPSPLCTKHERQRQRHLLVLPSPSPSPSTQVLTLNSSHHPPFALARMGTHSACSCPPRPLSRTPVHLASPPSLH